jgi:hypothetical protein
MHDLYRRSQKTSETDVTGFVDELVMIEQIMLGDQTINNLFEYERQNDPSEFLERLLHIVIPLP